jgi:hypothetical protein
LALAELVQQVAELVQQEAILYLTQSLQTVVVAEFKDKQNQLQMVVQVVDQRIMEHPKQLAELQLKATQAARPVTEITAELEKITARIHFVPAVAAEPEQ